MNFSSFNVSKSIGIVIVIGLLILALAAYMMARDSAGEEAVVVSDGPASESEATFVMLASELRSITFEAAVLSDPRFLALKDIHTAIVPEAPGRSDPFAPPGRR